MIFIEAAQLAWRNPVIVTRNPSGITQAARDAYATAKAMRNYRELQERFGTSFCRWCGDNDGLHVHHVEPVSVRPDLAADQANFMLLCAACHLHVGHGGNWKFYVRNVRDLCRVRDLTVTR